MPLWGGILLGGVIGVVVGVVTSVVYAVWDTASAMERSRE